MEYKIGEKTINVQIVELFYKEMKNGESAQYCKYKCLHCGNFGVTRITAFTTKKGCDECTHKAKLKYQAQWRKKFKQAKEQNPKEKKKTKLTLKEATKVVEIIEKQYTTPSLPRDMVLVPIMGYDIPIPCELIEKFVRQNIEKFVNIVMSEVNKDKK